MARPIVAREGVSMAISTATKDTRRDAVRARRIQERDQRRAKAQRRDRNAYLLPPSQLSYRMFRKLYPGLNYAQERDFHHIKHFRFRRPIPRRLSVDTGIAIASVVSTLMIVDLARYFLAPYWIPTLGWISLVLSLTFGEIVYKRSGLALPFYYATTPSRASSSVPGRFPNTLPSNLSSEPAQNDARQTAIDKEAIIRRGLTETSDGHVVPHFTSAPAVPEFKLDGSLCDGARAPVASPPESTSLEATAPAPDHCVHGHDKTQTEHDAQIARALECGYDEDVLDCFSGDAEDSYTSSAASTAPSTQFGSDLDLPGFSPNHVTIRDGLKTITIPIDREPWTVFVTRAMKKARKAELEEAAASARTTRSITRARVAEEALDEDYQDIPSHDPPSPPKRKRLPKAQVPVPNLSTPRDINTDLSWPGIDVEGLDFTVDATTTTANRFIDWVQNFGMQPAPNKTVTYTAAGDSAQHIRDLPFHDPNRLYRLSTEDVKLYDHERPDGTTYRAWRLRAFNIRNPQAGPVEVLTMHVNHLESHICPYHARTIGPYASSVETARRKGCQPNPPQACQVCNDSGRGQECAREIAHRDNMMGHNLVSESICGEDQKDKVIALGKIMVDFMNKAPFDLEIDCWNVIPRGQKPAMWFGLPGRRFLIIASLAEWKKNFKPDLDFSRLEHGMPMSLIPEQTAVLNNWHRNGLTKPVTFVQRNTRMDAGHWPGLWDVSGQTGTLSPSVIMERIDMSKVPDTSAIASFYFLGEQPQLDTPDHPATYQRPDTFKNCKLTDPKVVAAVQILQDANCQLLGYVGTVAQLRRAAEDLIQRSLKVDASVTGRPKVKSAGPINNMPFWGFPKPDDDKPRSVIAFGGEVYSSLSWRKDVRAPVRTSLYLSTGIRDRPTLAFIMNQSVEALASGQDILNCMWRAFMTAQRIELGLISKADVLSSYCACGNDAKLRQATSHHCMRCFRLQPCRSLTWQSTDGGPRYYCTACVDLSSAATDDDLGVGGFEGCVRHRVPILRAKDAQWQEPSWTSLEMINKLLSTYSDPSDPQKYVCAYTGRSVGLLDRVQVGSNSDPTRMGNGAWQSPFNLSFEKPHNQWLTSSGQWDIHHPDNTVVVMDCINRVKGLLAPMSLALLKRGLQLKERVAHLPPCVGYHEEVREEWENLERAYDNLHMIQSLTKRKSAERLKASTDSNLAAKIVSMERTGVWDTTIVGDTKSLFQTPTRYATHLPDGSLNAMWTREQWDQIKANVVQLEKIKNPHGLTIPRKGVDDVPWLWSMRHCPEDVDYKFIFRAMTARLDTMNRHCDSKHQTQESPATLYLEQCVQYLEDGGKCHMFGFAKTLISNHFASGSYGRGFRGASGTIIRAGDHMRTGCTVLFPTDMAKHYDINRRSVIWESWRANNMRWCHAGGEELIDALLEAVKDVKDESPWWTAVQDNYPEVPRPRFYKNHEEWCQTIASMTTATVDTDESEANEPILGEEEITLEAQLAETRELFDESGKESLTTEPQSSNEGQAPAGPQPWKPPQTRQAIDQWVDDDNKFLAGLSLPEAEKAKLLEIFERVQGIAKQKLYSDADASPSAIPGPASRNSSIDQAVVSELQMRYDGLADSVATEFDHLLGRPDVTTALQELQAAVEQGDPNAFQEAEQGLNKAVGY